MISKFRVAAVLALLAGLLPFLSAHAEITVGIVLSATGPAGSLGTPEKNTFALAPATMGGHKVTYVILDDASDTAKAIEHTKTLVEKMKVDVIIGSTVTPNSLAMIDTVARGEPPMISLASGAAIIDPMDAKRRWVFKVPQNDVQMAAAIAQDMAHAGVKSVGFIGFSDSYGDGWLREFSRVADVRKIKIVASERYNRFEKDVSQQVDRLLAADSEAILIAGSGTPAVVPEIAIRAKGYKGRIYQTHGVANNDFIKAGGAAVEGTLVPCGPVIVVDQLPASHPLKQSASTYVRRYEAAYGPGSVSSFGAHAWDAVTLLQNAVPDALTRAAPGTKEFRAALRDAIEQTTGLIGVHGIYNITASDHLGFDQRSHVMVTVQNGAWKLVQ